MNHFYRSVWSVALNTWMAVAENTMGKTKNSTARHRLITAGLLVYAANSWGLPTGEQLIAGQASVSVPSAGQMQIQQTTPQAILNWQGFSIQPHEIVSIQQPSINATLLNRVIGADASVIQGQLSANGQVFLINPNGVLFSNTAQVDVGGLIASTHTISNADFLNGNYHFTQNNNEGLLINQGLIKVPAGGVVALIGSQVSNEGTIESLKGTTALAAGKTVDLDFQGDGLLAVKVSEATLNAHLENNGAILADGGRVILTAQAAGDLINSVVNQTGIVRAQSLLERNGEIILAGGDNGVTHVSGKLDVSGQLAGGKINVTGKNVELAANAHLVAQALESGKAGTIAVFGDMKNGSLNVAGTLDASAPKNGDGGFIETSAAQVNVANSVKVTTQAAQGKTGQWLIDPSDFIIADGTAYSNELATTGVTLQVNSTGTSGNGDLFLNSPITWSTSNTLTLNAIRNITINAAINGGSTGNIVLNATTGAVSESTVTLQGNSLTANAATGIALNNANAVSSFNATNTTSGDISLTNTAANLNVTGINHTGTGNVNITNSGNIDVSGAVQTANGNFTVSAGTATAGTLNATGTVSVNGIFTLNTGTWNQVASSLPSFSATDFRLNSGGTFIRALGGDGSSAAPYQIGDVYGLQGMASSSMLAKSYSLGADINASATSAWNAGAGFVPIGNGGSKFTGSFDGLGHTISGLTINISNSTQNVGLFGGAGDTTGINSSSISNLGLINSVITGKINTGALAGVNYGTISNTYTTGTVTGSSDKTGGLAGINHGSISKSYSTASVTGLTNVGGLVGYNTDSSSSISNSYTTATVTGSSQIGGLVGNNQNGGNISNSYTAGSVSGRNFIGGLVGLNDTSSTISNAYSTSNVNGTGSSTGGLVGTNGAIINNSYATGSVVGNTAVGGLIGSTSAGTVTNAFWDTQTTGQTTSAGGTGKTTSEMQQLATFTAASWNINDAGNNTATWRIYEGNTTPLLRSFLTPLTITATNSKIYNGLSDASLSAGSYSVVGADTSGHIFNTVHPYGTAAINVGTYLLNGVYADQQGYDITTVGELTINPYPVDLTATRSYDGTVAVAANAVKFGALPNGETLSLTGTAAVANKNIGSNKPLSTPFGIANGTGLASNYTFTGGTQNATITPAALTLNAVTDTKVYDGTTTSTAVPTFAGLQTGDTLTGLTQVFTSPNVLGINNSTLVVNPNYTLNDGNAGGNYSLSTTTAQGTISATPLSAISLNGTRIYDGTTDVAANIFTLSGLQNNEDLTLSGVGTIASKNVGTYNSLNFGTLALGNGTVGLASNYSFAGGSQTIRITPAPLTLNAVTDSKVYDGTTTSTAMPTATGLQTGDTLTGLNQTFANKNVLGLNQSVLNSNTSYTLNDGNGGANYTVSSSSAQGTISPAPLTLNAVTDSKVYDGTTVSTAVPTFVGLQTGDSLTGLSQSFTSPNVLGINGSTLAVNTGYVLNDGNAGGNYSLNTTTALGTINAVLLNAISLNGSRVYDGTTDVAANSFTLSGLKNNDDLTLSGVGTIASKNVGTYNSLNFGTLALGNGAVGLASNYSFVGGSQTVTITPAALTLNATPDSKVYDGTTLSTAVPTATGLQIGDTLTGLTQAFTSKDVAGTNGSTLLANSGFILNDGNAGGNYVVNSNNALGTITPATLTYVANPVVSDNTTTPVFTGTVTGFVAGESLNTATSGTALFSSSANFNQTGNTAVNGSGLSASNYLFTQAASNATALTLITAPVVLPEPITPIPTPAPIATPIATPIPVPTGEVVEKSVDLQPQLVSLQTTPIPAVPSHLLKVTNDAELANRANEITISDSTYDFVNNPVELVSISSVSLPCNSGSCDETLLIPKLQVKNSAGRVERLELSANKRFLSLLLEDGTVRVWDFSAGLQRTIITPNNQALIDISTLDDKGKLISLASNAGVGTYEVISSSVDESLAIHSAQSNHFTTSADGRLLLLNQGDGLLSLWDNNRNKRQWEMPYQRGEVIRLTMDVNKRYGAVLSHQAGNYLLPANLKLKKLIDAVDIVDLRTGQLIKTLPNVGEEVVYMQFKNQQTLQIGLASGEMMDWSLTTGQKTTVAQFAETIASIDVLGDKYAYLRKNGTVRVRDSQGNLKFSVQNKENPFQFAKLIEDGEKLLTVLASGDIAIWEIASGKKIARLFSNAQKGWIVMDAFGRFDGSDEAIENFSWLAAEEDIPLDSFSENYYEPGLLISVLEDKNSQQNRAIKAGISLPPKLNLQLGVQQGKTGSVTVQLDVYNRGGGIEKVRFYHDGKLLSDENVQLTKETPDHRVLTLTLTPNAGENSVKAVASNAMGIENKSAELHFDGKTKAYTSHLRLFTVGVNKYSDPSLNLNYSVADANLILQTLKNNSKVAFSKSLTDEKATKQRILAELKELSRGEQHDVLAIYLAGHGMVIGKEWYFLPHETKMQPELKQIAAAGITSTELSEIFKNSNIQHILLMVDSCHSGASTDAFSNLENGQRYFTRQLSRSLGITVVTATVKEQEAAELESLGHGLFTYLLAEELKNKKTGNAITAHSIAASITKSLPAFSQKMLGFTQDPAVYTTGNNFMLIEPPQK